ncbi:MAG: LPS export ABC transporter ATP-binding protein [Planctomycetes bacterium]|nr:LPS export ABC transporter ATP-binding protein [Planctomycetota bacterium]
MLLEADNLVKSYSGRTVVDHVSYNVLDGEIVGLLGANGAGKTTSFRMTVGMITPEAGKVRFLGSDVTALPMYKRACRGIGYLSQETSVFQRLTVADNLLAICETMRFTRRERRRKVEDLLEQFGLKVIRNNLAKNISGGERRKLEIARALITKPRLILLDEPFSGVDPKAVEELRGEIFRLRESGIAVLLTDHNVHETLKVTDRSYVIHQGQVISAGTPHRLINDPRVRETYLGNTFKGDEFSPDETLLPPSAPEPYLPAGSPLRPNDR